MTDIIEKAMDTIDKLREEIMRQRREIKSLQETIGEIDRQHAALMTKLRAALKAVLEEL